MKSSFVKVDFLMDLLDHELMCLSEFDYSAKEVIFTLQADLAELVAESTERENPLVVWK